MSLFGDDSTASRQTPSALFADDDDAPDADAAAAASTVDRPSPSLFADDLDGGGGDGGGNGSSSPWALFTPKQAAARSSLVQTLLPPSDVPQAYTDAFDALLAADDGGSEDGNDPLSAGAVQGVLAQSGLDEGAKAQILDVMGVAAERPNRNEFNVLFALVGLAMEGEGITLDDVDGRKRDLPVPNLRLLRAEPVSGASKDGHTTAQSPAPHRRQPSSAGTPSKPRPERNESFADEADPWGSPALHRGHGHSEHSNLASQTNGADHASGARAVRTTSIFTTTSGSTATNPSAHTSGEQPAMTSNAGWAPGGFANPGLGGDGFGASGGRAAESGSGSPALGRLLGRGRGREAPGGGGGGGGEDVITVALIAEKEGMFLFQHRNYEVTSARRSSQVVRRYSDFVWLLDCLHKRYPFRQLPLLPPKRVAINGNHLAADASFVEKRRRGLARFANALVRHPVLSQEQLVVMFLTVPTELAVWRKQATISVQEEFAGKALPPDLEDSLPKELDDLFDRIRSGVRRSAELYIHLCSTMERLTKRNEGMAAESLRFSRALVELTEATADTYAVDTNDVPLLNEGLGATARRLAAAHGLLEDEARAWDSGVLEDVKRQRDCLVSMRDLFDRKDRLARDNIAVLERRIQSNEQKLAGLHGRSDRAQREAEEAKVEEAIVRDKQSIVAQHARGVFIKECVRAECDVFQHSLFDVSRLHQDWSQERVKYAELQADNWRALADDVESMPVGE